MIGVFKEHKTDRSAPLMTILIVLLIVGGVGASVWTLWQALRATPDTRPCAVAPAEPSPAPEASATLATPMPDATPLHNENVAHSFEQMRQQEANNLETAATLRRAQKAGRGAPWTEEQIQAVERGDLAIR
jgi:hypothetical protein